MTDSQVEAIARAIQHAGDRMALSVTTAILYSGLTPDSVDITVPTNERLQRAVHTARNILFDATTTVLAGWSR